jgi:hypothetical protein
MRACSLDRSRQVESGLSTPLPTTTLLALFPAVVMMLAQRLPVILIPEELRVPVVRLDMIDSERWGVARRVLCQACDTERVRMDVSGTRPLPLAPIASCM